MRALIIGQTAILLLLVAFWFMGWTQDFRNTQEYKAANTEFASEYPNAVLTVTGKIDEAWFFNYSHDGQNFQVVRLGDNWLNVE